jgi:signal transduction histidine kinase
MRAGVRLPTVCGDMLDDAPPNAVRALRLFGAVVLVFLVVAIATTEPRPGVDGEGRWVAIGLVGVLAGLVVALARIDLPLRVRFAGMAVGGAASVLLTALQPDGGAIAGVYVVIVMAALRLPRTPALLLCAALVVAETVVLAAVAEQPEGAEFAFLSSAVPWFLVMRMVRELRWRQRRAEQLVEELRESRAAHAESAALAERGRLARDMHDVLAHSLSALALQLEATRLLARERGADPDVVRGVERAHHLAADGLDEARRAIAALRGDELPGPERLQALAEAFAAESDVTCTVSVSGEPRELDAEARLALYRTAQEALTNVRRHSAADRAELRLAYEPDGVKLVVEDRGAGAPVAVGAGGDGYGLTGMRERAELLGGRLRAGPTGDGFRVELWLPA